ncbi:GNAT family N-acetyltransferase [Jiella avicenniae]|uniref:GNAT family N-acetyltransferase n=1 Tax=Jiella avicenniae TaxID=2907202 RepID=A0A9X1NWK9_9HYPH|nr:GNAT family N-acetyltransferase [Jiella avicenniae]MCE7027090.1 GNAT family N-acetyltransferase [Jiella avicenniae]
MHIADLAAVMQLAGRIHPGLPEDEAVFAERLELFPKGCRVLVCGEGIAGYALAHPIHYPHPPSLDTLVGAIPPDADAFYIHDVAIAPEARGRGHAEAVVAALLEIADGFPRACLVSVYGTAAFWQRFGFVATDGEVSAEKLAGYGDDARFMVRLTQD